MTGMAGLKPPNLRSEVQCVNHYTSTTPPQNTSLNYRTVKGQHPGALFTYGGYTVSSKTALLQVDGITIQWPL